MNDLCSILVGFMYFFFKSSELRMFNIYENEKSLLRDNLWVVCVCESGYGFLIM